MSKTISPGALRDLIVGSYLHDGRRHFLPTSQAEIDRARVAAQRWLGTFRFEQGSNLILSFSNEEAAHAVPFERAVISLGLVSCTCEVATTESKRVEMIMRRLGAVGGAVFSDALIEGLAEVGKTPGELFQGKVLWLRPAAYQALESVPGIILRRWLDVGPAMAFECVEGAGAHIDRLEWHVGEEDGHVTLTSRLPRAMDFHKWRSDVRAIVDHGICRCGSADPRLIPRDD
jgi:hypothetical protein